MIMKEQLTSVMESHHELEFKPHDGRGANK